MGYLISFSYPSKHTLTTKIKLFFGASNALVWKRSISFYLTGHKVLIFIIGRRREQRQKVLANHKVLVSTIWQPLEESHKGIGFYYMAATLKIEFCGLTPGLAGFTAIREQEFLHHCFVFGKS